MREFDDLYAVLRLPMDISMTERKHMERTALRLERNMAIKLGWKRIYCIRKEFSLILMYELFSPRIVTTVDRLSYYDWCIVLKSLQYEDDKTWFRWIGHDVNGNQIRE